MRVLVLAALACCSLSLPARAQTVPVEPDQATEAAEARRPTFEPSDEAIERIQLALRANRPKAPAGPSLFGGRAVELTDGLDLVAQPVWMRPMPGAVMYGPPTHEEMRAVMTPRWFTEGHPSGDALGVATGTAVSLLPTALRALAGLFEGPAAPEQHVLDAEAESAAIAFAGADDRVLEARIRQQGRTLHLSMVVREGTSPEAARRLGAQFVVLVKSLVPAEPNPAATIGAGVYDYLVAVGSPRDETLASGGKSSTDALLTWDVRPAETPVAGIVLQAR